MCIRDRIFILDDGQSVIPADLPANVIAQVSNEAQAEGRRYQMCIRDRNMLTWARRTTP